MLDSVKGMSGSDCLFHITTHSGSTLHRFSSNRISNIKGVDSNALVGTEGSLVGCGAIRLRIIHNNSTSSNPSSSNCNGNCNTSSGNYIRFNQGAMVMVIRNISSSSRSNP